MARRLARPYLEDMRAFAREAADFLGDRSGEDLSADRMRLLAVTRAAEIVGEAASRVPKIVQGNLLQIEFADAIAMRNVIAHGYGTIDPTILVDTIRTDFPALLVALEEALAGRLPDEDG